ncbi:unnamed protein product [Ixodes pacificus]
MVEASNKLCKYALTYCGFVFPRLFAVPCVLLFACQLFTESFPVVRSFCFIRNVLDQIFLCLTRTVLTLAKHVFCLGTLCKEEQKMQNEKCTASGEGFFLGFFSVLPHVCQFSMWDF